MHDNNRGLFIEEVEKNDRCLSRIDEIEEFDRLREADWEASY